jgi:very-short-patch-repair endonuclease
VGVGFKSRFNSSTLKTGMARRLRRDGTDAEMILWQKLRNSQLGVAFRRQHPAGPYVLDFYCPALRFAIELDGGQHAEPNAVARDRERTRWLADRGVILVRYWNSDVTVNPDGVLESIAARINDLRKLEMTPTRRWRADLPLSGGG